MKQFNGFDEAKQKAAYSAGERLPVGGYVCEILGVKLVPGQNGKSDSLTVQFDITEGEYKEFFKKQYEANTSDNRKYKGTKTIWLPTDDGSEKDGWTKTAFARWTNALEDSNSGYKWDWDETKWKGKKIGLIFGETGSLIEGKEVVYTECRKPTSVQSIRDNTFKAEKFVAKNGYGGTGATNTAAASSGTEFMSIPDGLEEELPFK